MLKLLKGKFHRLLQQHHITKHMIKVYFSCYVILVPSGLIITMIFPYLLFMVEFLLPDVEHRNIGKYSGFLASSMYFGGMCSSYFWGWLADKYNKKTILMCSGVCMAFSSLFFGFSINFYMAVIFRFLTGLSNGIVVNVKAIISEHSDDVNQGFGMSLVIALWDASIVIGPAISGVLADPVGQYNLSSNSFLEKFPYCLPNMCTALLCVLGVVTVGCLLPDKPEQDGDDEDTTTTQSTGNAATGGGLSVKDTVVIPVDSDSISLCTLEGGKVVETLAENTKEKSSPNGLSYRELLAKEEIEENTITMEELLVNDSDKKVASLSVNKSKYLQTRKEVISGCQVFISLIKDKVTVGAVLLWGVYAFGVIGFEETSSLWSATDKSLGGLGFSPHDIGTVLGIAGLLLVPVSLIVFIPTFHIHMVFVIILVPIFPSFTYIENAALLWMLLGIFSVIIRVAINNCFVCESLFLNNSVTPDKLGIANGLANAVTNVFQIFSPVLFGTIYSLSLSDTAQDIGFPVDFHLTFILLSFVFFLALTLVAFFPKRLDQQQKY